MQKTPIEDRAATCGNASLAKIIVSRGSQNYEKFSGNVVDFLRTSAFSRHRVFAVHSGFELGGFLVGHHAER